MSPADSPPASVSQQLKLSLYWGLLLGGLIGLAAATYETWYVNHFIQKGLTNLVLEIFATRLLLSVLAVFCLFATLLAVPTLISRLFASLSNTPRLSLSFIVVAPASALGAYHLNTTSWFPPFFSTPGVLANLLLSLLALGMLSAFYKLPLSFRFELRLPLRGFLSGLYSSKLLLLLSLAFLGFNAVASWKASAHQPQGPNLVILTIDTLRADHLGCYGYQRDTSPNIDKLASEGVRFDHAFSPRGLTWPALTSLMTSLYPKTHGVRENQVPLERRYLTLAEILRNAGYKTGAFLANYYYSPNRGFDVKKGDEVGDLDAAVTRAAVKWLDKIDPQRERFFLWLHQKSPHAPYEPKKHFLDMFDPDYSGTFNGKGPMTDAVFVDKLDLDPRDLFHLIALYDAEVRAADAHIGHLLDKLREIGAEDDTLIVFLADHGEELYDHNYYFYHACSVYDSVLRVPLVFKFPKVLSARKVVANQMATVDIAPSILQLLKLPVPRVFEGRSLLPLLFDVGSDDWHTAFAERTESIFSIRTPQWKYIHNPENDYPECLERRGNERTPYVIQKQLYDVKNDPGEKKNVISEYAEVARDLEAQLLEWVNSNKRVHKEYELSKDARERLRALGYIQ